MLPSLAKWISSPSNKTPGNLAFLSGASFAMLDLILRQESAQVPADLLLNSLALKAAVATLKLEGRSVPEQDIRDAFYLTLTGDARGPNGDMLAFWRNAARIRLDMQDWQQKLKNCAEPHLQGLVKGGLDTALDKMARSGPMPAAVTLMKNILKTDDRAERLACLFSDVILAKYFRWNRPLPLTALHLTKANLRELKNGTVEMEASIQAFITKSAQTAFRLANSLTLKADALRAVAPKLRARGSAEAVALFLSEEAVAPSGMLSPYIQGTRTPMTGRAARRLCDRLVELGVVKELTGRSTFRLYGVAP